MNEGSGRRARSDERTGRLTPAAFAARFQGAWPALWCIAAAVLRNRSGADDVLQEAAVIALGKLAQFDPQTNFMAWMGKIVRLVALNHGRRKLKAVNGAEMRNLEMIAASDRSVATTSISSHGDLLPETSDFDDRVLHALHALDETARACLLLRTVLNMPYREISLALDIAEGTAMSHVHRARSAMRHRLMPATITNDGGTP